MNARGMPTSATDEPPQPPDSSYGFKRDSDIPDVVYEVGTWPPPRGPVPPAAKGKAQHLIGITIVGNVEMFMYRSDMGPAPKTWDEVKANADKNKKPNFWGYVVRGKATNPIVADFLPILWSFGGDVFDQNWNVTIDNAASLKAVKFLVQDLKAAAPSGSEGIDAAERERLLAPRQADQTPGGPGGDTTVH